MSSFWKVSGGGNDFIALVEPSALPGSDTIRAWCRRGISLGADGLFALERTSEDGVVSLRYFNADGFSAELCLNATRCAARLVDDLSWVPPGQSLTLRTGAGDLRARRTGAAEAEVEVPAPFGLEPRDLEAAGQTWHGVFLTVGVPHFVISWTKSLDEAPLESVGPLLRYHPALGPAGANVNFVRFTGANDLEIRTWERGVEAETLACGTGVLASTAVGLGAGLINLPVTVQTAGGFRLSVRPCAGEGGHERTVWALAGDARIVAQGNLAAGADVVVAPSPFEKSGRA